MKRKYSVSVYYNEEFGYIVAPDTTIVGTIIYTTLNPVEKLESNCSFLELGKTILKGIEKSEEALPVERSEIKDYKFWHISGIKGFNTFSKKFKCIDISEDGEMISIQKLIREKDGSYGFSKVAKIIKIVRSNDFVELGKAIYELFNLEENIKEDEFNFKTHKGTKIKFDKISEEFIDRGDNGTDTFQVYVYGGYESNYIAFLDLGDLEFNVDSLKEKILKKKGVFKNMTFEKTEGKITCQYMTNSRCITTCIIPDKDSVLEIVYEINTVDTPIELQSKIKLEFEELISSMIFEK